MSKHIYLSPSNHGKNQNRCLHSGCYEDKHTRPIALACRERLMAAGFKVTVASETKNMEQRCREADALGADLYIPIHTNASSSQSARYLLLMFYDTTAAYKNLFDAVAPCLERIYPGKLKARMWKRRDLYEINVPRARTMYCELGFHTNPTDCDGFIHRAELVGGALAEGICRYFGVTLPAGSASPENIASPSGSMVSQKGCAAGQSVKLTACPLYATAAGKSPAGTVTGTYYLWDANVISGRIRITNLASRVGKAGQVTGWIDISRIK